MAALDQSEPARLTLPVGTLDLEYTLTNGQLFRWRRTRDGWWDVVTGGRMLRIRQGEEQVEGEDVFEFFTYPEAADEAFLRRYLRLDVDLPALYTSWREADPYLGSLTEKFRGLRIVGQDPEECLLSFICSTANFIPRIMKSIAALAANWGEPILGPSATALTNAFPTASVIAALNPDEVIDKTGLEWRGANLVKVARQVAAQPVGWVASLAELDYASARTELTRLDGVGPKIADCVCVFALGKDQAVPVDTHVWQLTKERYLPTLRGKSVSGAGYAQVLGYFQSHFEKAGWAQQYLFYDHLLASRERGPRP